MMGEDVIIQIWCDDCGISKLDSGDARLHSRADLREGLIEEGWVISRNYRGHAYCPKCAKERGLSD